MAKQISELSTDQQIMEEVLIELTPKTKFSINNNAKVEAIFKNKDDPYLLNAQRYELQVKMKRRPDDSADHDDLVNQFMEMCCDAIVILNEDELNRIELMILKCCAYLEQFEDLLSYLPEVIYVGVTTGDEEANACYCRDDQLIVMVQDYLSDMESFVSVFVHEMWHIISGNIPDELRDSVYGVIGYEPLGHVLDIDYEGLGIKKLSNPDTVLIRHKINVEIRDIKYDLTQILYLAKPYDPSVESSFFQYIAIGFIALEKINGTWSVLIRNNYPIVFQSRDLPNSFWEIVSRNTEYIFHCEEMIAENWVSLVLKKPVDDLHILQRLELILKSEEIH